MEPHLTAWRRRSLEESAASRSTAGPTPEYVHAVLSCGPAVRLLQRVARAADRYLRNVAHERLAVREPTSTLAAARDADYRTAAGGIGTQRRSPARGTRRTQSLNSR